MPIPKINANGASFEGENGLQATDLYGLENNTGLFDDGSGYGINSASDMSNGVVDNFLDPTGFVKGFYNDMMGFTSQEREFEQQFKMSDYQNRWNSAQAQMERAKAAGINPLTAASGIAGSGTSSVAGAGGSATPSSAAADAIGRLGSMRSQNDLASGQAEKAYSEARNIDRLADAEVFSKAASAAKDLVSCGIPEIQAMSLGLKFARDGLDGFAQAFNADNYCRMYDLEYDKLESEINSENIRFAEIEARKNLYISEKEFTEARTAHENVLKDIDNRKLDLGKKYEAMFADGGDLQQFLLAKQFGVDSPEYKGYMQFISDKFYNQADAAARASWNSRPSSPTEAIWYIVNELGFNLRSLLDQHLPNVIDLLDKVKSNREAQVEFNEAYEDYRSDLYQIYRDARREYRSYKFSGASDAFKAQLKNRMDSAYKDYKECTKEKFSDILVSKISPRSE